MFFIQEIVWAKVKGYPWWPAEISKLPSLDQNYYKVSFIGENNHAHLEQKNVRKYQQNYNNFKIHKYKGLQSSIQLADQYIQKQKQKNIIQNNDREKIKQNQTVFKGKKIITKNPKRLQLLSKRTTNIKNKKQKDNIKIKLTIQKDQDQIQIQPYSEKQIKSSERQLLYNQQQLKAQKLQQSQFQSEDANFNILRRNVDRKKIQSIESELMNFIAKFNSNNYCNTAECFNLILNIEKQSFKPEQIGQSKITNMIAYISKNISNNHNVNIKRQIQKIKQIGEKLRTKVVQNLFSTDYYQFYLKKMQKNQQQNIFEIQKRQKLLSKIYTKKN